MNKKLFFLIFWMLLVLLFNFIPVYAEAAEEKISVYVNNVKLEFDVPPVSENGRTLVPVRAIFEALGAEVSWDNETKTVTAVKDKTIIITVGDTKAYVDDVCVILSVPAKTIEGRTFVPLRFVSESLGAVVDWNGETKTVYITHEDSYKNPQFDEVQSILDKTRNNTLSLNKYKKSANINLNINVPDSGNTYLNLAINGEYDLANKSAHELYTYDYKDSTADVTCDFWIKDNYYYTNNSANPQWIIRQFTDEEINGLLDRANSFEFLESDKNLCNSLSVNEEDPSTIVLECSGDFFNYLYSISGKNNDLNLEIIRDLGVEFNDIHLKYVIDKNTYCLKSFSLGTNISKDGVSLDMDVNVQFTDIGGNYKIVVPQSAIKAKNKYIQASKYSALAYNELRKGAYDRCISYCNTALNIYPLMSNTYIYKGTALFYKKEYEKAISVYEAYNKQFPDDYSIFGLMAECYFYLGQIDEAESLCKDALTKNPRDFYAYNVWGIIELNREEYQVALALFERAIQLNEDFTAAYENKMHTLFCQANYNKCLEFAEEVKKELGESYNIYWYKAACLENQYRYNEAILENKKLLEIDPDAYSIMSDIAWDYYYEQNYAMAGIYNKKALALSPDHYSSQRLKVLLEYENSTSEAKKIADFVSDNYLYKKDVPDFEKKCGNFASKGDNITTADIESFIKSITIADDKHTTVVSGDNYVNLMDMENQELFSANTLEGNSNIEYVRLLGFDNNTSVKFNEYIHSIENPSDKYLIIDLRYNTGGLTVAGNKMLDLLLANCITSYTIDRDGYISAYESNKYNIKFKHIFILVNKYTASCAELFAMSMQRYLDNATVIGTTTYGKGVGQVVFENKKSQYAIYLAEHYWNVGEQNIQNKSVVPDLVIEADTDIIMKIKVMIAAGIF